MCQCTTIHSHAIFDIPFLHNVEPFFQFIHSIQLSDVVRMRRYNVRFDEESIAQGSHSRREGVYENDGERGSDNVDRISSTSFR